MKNKDKKYHYLYKTTNLINEKYYYGIHSTNDLEDGYLGSGIYLKRSIRKYGKENFKREILQMFDTRDELVNAEKEIITEQVLKDKYCMNCQYGGEGFNTIGMVTVKDANGNTFKTFCDDPRYLSGELVVYLKNIVTAKDKNNNILCISINDPRYLSGELVGISKNINKTEEHKQKIKNTINNKILSNNFISAFKGKIHSEETKKKMSESSKGKCLGEKNGSYGTCWITNNIENKKIKKEELDQYINNGWFKGRKLKD